jgi:hypothetical protein
MSLSLLPKALYRIALATPARSITRSIPTLCDQGRSVVDDAGLGR